VEQPLDFTDTSLWGAGLVSSGTALGLHRYQPLGSWSSVQWNSPLTSQIPAFWELVKFLVEQPLDPTDTSLLGAGLVSCGTALALHRYQPLGSWSSF